LGKYVAVPKKCEPVHTRITAQLIRNDTRTVIVLETNKDVAESNVTRWVPLKVREAGCLEGYLGEEYFQGRIGGPVNAGR
jgi:hypothetical protein